MKKLLALVLSLCFVLAIAPVSFAAAANPMEESFISMAKEKYKDVKDSDLYMEAYTALLELRSRDLLNADYCKEIFQMFDIGDSSTVTRSSAPVSSEYSFSKGRFYAGTDFQTGTYDITCVKADDESYSSSMNSLGDVYSGLGMGDFGDLFGSFGSLYDDLSGMTVTVYDARGSWDNYYTIKSGESVRISLYDGMSVEFDGGTATMTFIR